MQSETCQPRVGCSALWVHVTWVEDHSVHTTRFAQTDADKAAQEDMMTRSARAGQLHRARARGPRGGQEAGGQEAQDEDLNRRRGTLRLTVEAVEIVLLRFKARTEPTTVFVPRENDPGLVVALERRVTAPRRGKQQHPAPWCGAS